MKLLAFQVVNLLKAGKGKEVSYNALATHIIAEDGDNPEVGESREVFDLPVVKVSMAHFAHLSFTVYSDYGISNLMSTYLNALFFNSKQL